MAAGALLWLAPRAAAAQTAPSGYTGSAQGNAQGAASYGGASPHYSQSDDANMSYLWWDVWLSGGIGAVTPASKRLVYFGRLSLALVWADYGWVHGADITYELSQSSYFVTGGDLFTSLGPTQAWVSAGAIADLDAGSHRIGSLGAHTQFGFRASLMLAGVLGGEYQRRKWYAGFNGRTENAFYFVLRIPFSKVGDAEGFELPGRLLACFDC